MKLTFLSVFVSLSFISTSFAGSTGAGGNMNSVLETEPLNTLYDYDLELLKSLPSSVLKPIVEAIEAGDILLAEELIVIALEEGEAVEE